MPNPPPSKKTCLQIIGANPGWRVLFKDFESAETWTEPVVCFGLFEISDKNLGTIRQVLPMVESSEGIQDTGWDEGGMIRVLAPGQKVTGWANEREPIVSEAE